MRPDDIRALFEPVGPVDIKRMFGGHGIYRDGRMMALSVDGGLFMKTDESSRPAFAAAGAKPFTYAKADGSVTALSYWSLPEEAFDDPELLAEWVRLADAAAARAAALKPAKRRRKGA